MSVGVVMVGVDKCVSGCGDGWGWTSVSVGVVMVGVDQCVSGCGGKAYLHYLGAVDSEYHLSQVVSPHPSTLCLNNVLLKWLTENRRRCIHTCTLDHNMADKREDTDSQLYNTNN